MGNLEKEFSKAVVNHKVVIIRLALDLKGDELYSNYLLKEFRDKYNDVELYEKSIKVENDLYEEQEKYNSNKYNQVYELCWETIKESIPEGRII